MRRTADVVIVGGGCMGASVAWHLTGRGITNVVLVEREPVLGAGSTGRNAGGVRHQFSHEANVRLSIESIRVLEQFKETVGAEIDFWQDGYLFLLSSAAEVEAFERGVAMQRALGVDVDWLEPGDAARLAPGLSTEGVRAATFCARDGIADPSGVTHGFANAARAKGVEIRRRAEVTGITLTGGRVTGIETTAGRIDAPIVVNAAGPWAGRVAALAGCELPIVPLRRHIFIAASESGQWAGGAPESRIMVIDFESTFYFHREGAGVLFGMGEKNEQPGFDTTVQWDLLARVIPVAERRLPALADASITQAWAGLYEMTPDAMPLIGPVAGVDGLHVIAGFSGHGFQHSPAAGRILADVIAGRDPAFDLSPFLPTRFATGATAAEVHVV
jgi:sarcosine oxidase subunit beta